MSWESLAPAAKKNASPMASICVRVNKAGEVSCWLFLSNMLAEALGDPDRCDVLAGTGDDAGRLLLAFDPPGVPIEADAPARAFELRPVLRGSLRLTVPRLPGAPDAPTGAEVCSIVSRERGELILALPIEAWSRFGQKRLPAPAPALSPRSSSEPPASDSAAKTGGGNPCPARPLDAVEYLTPKGHKISRLANGRWMLNGEPVAFGAIVKTVNAARRQADLDPLPPEAIR